MTKKATRREAARSLIAWAMLRGLIPEERGHVLIYEKSVTFITDDLNFYRPAEDGGFVRHLRLVK